MNKDELINEVVYEMSPNLTREQIDRLKITMLVKMQNCEVSEMQYLPAVWTHDNEWIINRFRIDSIAKGMAKSTLNQYVIAVRKLLRDTGKHYREITGQDVTDYLAVRQYRDKISVNYKVTLRKYFSSFFGWAFRKKHIDNNIMDDVDSMKSIQKKKDCLSDDEVESIRESGMTVKERAIFELMVSTGLRVGEISLLNVSDVDFAHRRISVFGEKTQQYRTALLTIKASRAIKRYIDSRKQESDALFLSDRKPYGRMQKPAFEKVAKRIARRTGITRINATVHVYRKTFVTSLYRKTKNILMVSKLAGHAQTDTTVKYYLIDDLEDMQYTYNLVNG
ncbi:MAG: tyrosine-type recombinase/integrase [Lachnospiraceae bacterium]|nr:tyrosine-type recombinase/integrase [Lachnospiraceae bacterium]